MSKKKIVDMYIPLDLIKEQAKREKNCKHAWQVLPNLKITSWDQINFKKPELAIGTYMRFYCPNCEALRRVRI